MHCVFPGLPCIVYILCIVYHIYHILSVLFADLFLFLLLFYYFNSSISTIGSRSTSGARILRVRPCPQQASQRRHFSSIDPRIAGDGHRATPPPPGAAGVLWIVASVHQTPPARRHSSRTTGPAGATRRAASGFAGAWPGSLFCIKNMRDPRGQECECTGERVPSTIRFVYISSYYCMNALNRSVVYICVSYCVVYLYHDKPRISFHRSNVSLDAPCLRYLGNIKHSPNPRWAQHDNETIKRWIH